MGGCQSSQSKEHLMASIADTRQEMKRVIREISELKQQIIADAEKPEPSFINTAVLNQSVTDFFSVSNFSGCIQEMRKAFEEAREQNAEAIQHFNRQIHKSNTEKSAQFSEFILKKRYLTKEGLFLLMKITDLDREMEELEYRLKEAQIDMPKIERDSDILNTSMNNLQLEIEKLNQIVPEDVKLISVRELEEEKDRILGNIEFMNNNSPLFLKEQIQALEEEKRELLQRI